MHINTAIKTKLSDFLATQNPFLQFPPLRLLCFPIEDRRFLGDDFASSQEVRWPAARHRQTDCRNPDNFGSAADVYDVILFIWCSSAWL